MSDSNIERPSRLEGSRSPVAIIHEGFFVYANRAFLDRLAYKSFDDLAEVPLLDLVEQHNHDALRTHLDAAKKSAGTDRRHPEARLTFLRSDELPVTSDCTAFRTRYAGEECIQLTLTPSSGEGLTSAIRDLPWRQYLSIAFLALFTILPSMLLLKLDIDNSPTVYFPDDEPAVVVDRELRTRFPNDQLFVVVFQGVALYSDGFLAAYDELGQALLALPEIDDVISATSADHISSEQNALVIDKLIDTSKLHASHPSDRSQHIAGDRFAADSLIARNRDALSMIVIPHDIGNSVERLRLQQTLLELIDDHGLRGYLKATAGWMPVDVAMLNSMLRDNALFIPATVTIGLICIWLLFRRWYTVLLAGASIGVVVNSTVAFYVLFSQPFTLVSSTIPPLLSALTLAALVHLFNALYQASHQGFVGRERVKRALREVDKPAKYSALTTAAGLASLATSPIVPINTFGLISAIGVGLIYLVVYRVLPNVIVRWEHKPWPRVESGVSAMDGAIRMLMRASLRHPVVVVLLFIVGIAVSGPQISKVAVETSFQQFFAEDHPVREATNFVDEHFVGTMPLEVVLNASQRDGLTNSETLKAIRDFQNWVEQLPQVDRAFSMVDVIEELHWAFRGEDSNFRTIPDDDQLISQLLLIYDGEDLYDFVDRDFMHAHVALNLNAHGANEINAVMRQIRAYLDEHIGSRIEWNIAGAGRLFADMEELLVAGQVYSLWGALVLIFAFMVVQWRSLWSALLCMVPNLSPILLIFIVMGATGIWLDMATALIASVAVGIAVDDTIHVYHGFRHRVKLGIDPLLALARTYREAGRAVVVTTLILTAQFLVLVTTDFVPISNFGLLTAIGLFAALVFDLLLLPALLIIAYGNNSPVARWLERVRGRKPEQIAEQALGVDDIGYDEELWTAERKITLVKEILAGRTDTASAAREHSLPQSEVDRWVTHAVRGINDALGGAKAKAQRDPDKVRSLARAYKRLQKENRKLKEQLPPS